MKARKIASLILCILVLCNIAITALAYPVYICDECGGSVVEGREVQGDLILIYRKYLEDGPQGPGFYLHSLYEYTRKDYCNGGHYITVVTYKVGKIEKQN